jgi:hypothetical protein
MKWLSLLFGFDSAAAFGDPDDPGDQDPGGGN